MTVEAKHVTIYKAKDGWRWHARDTNGKLVAESGEAYERQGACLSAASQLFPHARIRVQHNGHDA
jgi:hypothetical protein